ncbi:MAG: D-alanine--D-alanine ligase [Planctomycetota bacterium]|nr:MAG: D-alanine--D-alanine ligase [Planctomycetota bacterium]
MTGRAHWTGWEAPGPAAALARTSVVVLYGGTSAEREVSIRSGRAVAAALASEPPPASVTSVEISSAGRWIVAGEAIPPAAALERLPADALFFLGLHGGEGEDGRVQAFLELAGRRFTGSPHLPSARCMDKHLARLLFAHAGLRVAPGQLVKPADWRAQGRRGLEEFARAGGPWYVKPRCGGSSVATFRVAEPAGLAAAVERVFATGDDALVERSIQGLEVTCAVFGNRGTPPTSLPVVEITPREGRFFDYTEKYAEGGAVEVCPPEQLPPELADRVEQAARTAYLAADCEGYARVDFIVPDTEPRTPVVLEANTLPGLTARSLLPLAAGATGVSFREMCLEICSLALARTGSEGQGTGHGE